MVRRMKTRRRLHPARSLSAFLLAGMVVVVGCAPAVTPAGTSPTAPSNPAGSTAPGSHQPPVGATASVDATAWALADRLTAPAYTSDTTAALVEGLARAGIGTYADTTSATPEVPVSGAASPFELLAFQAHALAVGAWAGASWSGAELDGVVPVPTAGTGLAPTSALLAGYVGAVDSPGAALSRALLAGQDLLNPASLRFPGVVLVLFASDLATGGGHVAGPGPSPSAAAFNGSRLLAFAAPGPGDGRVALPGIAVGSICSATANWIQGTINRLFDALKVAAPSSFFGSIFSSIWNFVVDKLQAFVQGVISSVTDVVLGTIRSVAGAIAAAAEQVASILPYAVTVTAGGGAAGAVFFLGPDPQAGVYTAAVSSGDLPAWPDVLQDCANVAGIALPDFSAKQIPLTWGPLRAPADPLLAPVDAARTSTDVTDATGHASWAFLTSSDPGEPTGQRQDQQDVMPVAVHRPELDRLRAKLTDALLGFVPGLLRPFVTKLLAPALDGLQGRLDGLLDARGTGTAYLVFHGHASPAPSASTTPAPSGSCSPSPLPAGTYTGTITNKSLETIDISNGSTIGKTVATSDGTGAATVVVAADGSVGGTWTLRASFVFDETAGSSGALVIKDHRDEVYDYSGGSMAGTACALSLVPATIRIVSCMDSLKGDCSGDPPPGSSAGFGVKMGAPSAVSPGKVTWTWQYAETGGQPSVSDTLTLSVSGP
jgi:hypothetical protein